ncbi:MAG: hypothetical protein K2X47_16740 [Bdellovibrionales bacterium]|nr:hypothetical protein [Bdellovibrionales bacterium]
MSDSQSTDKGDRQFVLPENRALKSKDALDAQNAGIADISAAEKIRTNASNGSLQKYAGLAEQEKSLELVDYQSGGSGAVIAARVMEKAAPVTEATKSSVSMQELITRARDGDLQAGDLVHQMRAAATLPPGQSEKIISRLQKSADDVYGNQPGVSQEHWANAPDNINTQAMEDLAPVSEVARSALEMRQNIDKHMAPGPERDKLVAQLKADVTPVLRGHVELPDQDNEFRAFTKLPLEQRKQVIEALSKCPELITSDYNEQLKAIGVAVPKGLMNCGKHTIEAVIGLGRALGAICEFSHDVYFNHERAIDKAGKAGDALGKAMVVTVRLGQLSEDYLGEVGAAAQFGDSNKAFRDIAWLSQEIDVRWQKHSEAEKVEIATEFTSGMALPDGVAKIARSEKLTQVLEQLAAAVGPGGRKKFSEKLGNLLDRFFPVTPDGQRIKVSKQVGENDCAMTGADDLGGVGKSKDVQSGKLEKPSEVTKEALDNPEGLAKLAKKFGINMPPKDTYVFIGEKDAVSAEAAARRLHLSVEQLKGLDESSLIAQKLERVPDYRDAFFNKHPGLIPVADRITVHHAIPKWVLKEHPGLFSAKEVNDVESLRGIYKSINDELHNDKLHNAWRYFAMSNQNPTRREVLQMVEKLDTKYGRLFIPTEGR